VNSQMTW